MNKISTRFGNDCYKIIFFILVIGFTISTSLLSKERSKPIIIDHTCNDLSKIPDYWIEQVKDSIKVYYGHASHGAQLTGGLERISDSNSKYSYEGAYYLPTTPNTLCFYETYNNPDMFFSEVQGILNANPSINVAMFAWCGEASWYDIDKYTSDMEALEDANPGVTFVYMTGNTQEGFNAGYGRYKFNQALRQFCRDSNKVLYDFADLDVWYKDEYTPNTYDWDDYGRKPLITGIPLEHPQYHGDDYGHTTWESCENKAKAVWWMLARIAGWDTTITPTPVEMVSFKASVKGKGIQLTWQTASEKNNFGFEIERSFNKKQFQKIGFVRGHDTINVQQNYLFWDNSVKPGNRYYYRLKQLNLDGTYEYSSIIEISIALPEQFNLEQNYPNPFNPTTEICYSLPRSAHVKLTIFDTLGRNIVTLVNEEQTAGHKAVIWNGKDENGTKVSSGLYIYQLNAEGIAIAKKMIIVR